MAGRAQGPVGFVVVVWDSESDSLRERRAENVLLEDFGNIVGLALSLWQSKTESNDRKLAQQQMKLQQRFLVRVRFRSLHRQQKR